MLENLPPGHIRHVILNEFLKGTNASQAAANINKVYGEGATTERTCRRWFVKFRSGDRSLEDEPGRGSEPHLDNAALLRLLSGDNRQTTRELAEQLVEIIRSGGMNLLNLPPLVLSKVVRYLDVPSLSKTAKTNRVLYQIIMENRYRLPRPRLYMSMEEGHVMIVNRLNGQPMKLRHRENNNQSSNNRLSRKLNFIRKIDLEKEYLENLLERADLEHLSMDQMYEEELQTCAGVFRGNLRCRVRKLSLHIPYMRNSSSLCQFICSLSGVESFKLELPVEVITKELFGLPQIRAATETLIVKIACFPFEHRHLSLTDTDILNLSARSIEIHFECDFSTQFLRNFVQKLLSKKRLVSPNERGLKLRRLFPDHGMFIMKTTALNEEEIFKGLLFQPNTPNIGKRSGTVYVSEKKRTDGQALEYRFDDHAFVYRLFDGLHYENHGDSFF